MNQEVLRKLLEKLENGTCTEAEQALIQEWYDSFEEVEIQVKNVLELDGFHADMLHEQMWSAIQNQTITNPIVSSNPRWLPIKKNIYWIAAGILILFSALIHLFLIQDYSTLLKTTVITTTEFEHKTVHLPDSSIIRLHPNSSVSFNQNFSLSNRKIEFQGEALFQIQKDSTSPFEIKVNEMFVKVLGTTFNIRAYAQDSLIETHLYEGSVSIENNKSPFSTPIILSPNQSSYYHKQQQTFHIQEFTTPDTPTNQATNTKRQDKELVFDGVAFKDLLNVLENRFQVRIHIKDKVKLDCLITANFEYENLDEILSLLASINHFTYTIVGPNIYIDEYEC